jgi:predicted nucleotidyltransferase
MEQLAQQLARIPGVVAVALGGSRAQDTHRPDSDWDFGLYYRGTLDAADVRALGYSGEVFEPGEWAYPMNGGAWLTIGGEKVDLIYRDLTDVERWTRAAEKGDWKVFRVPGYLAGMASYVLVGELALGKTLVGELPRPAFPEALRTTAPKTWRWEAGFALDHAQAHARRGDVAACIGKLSLAVLAMAQAQLAADGEWALNEKGIVGRAGLEAAEAALGEGTAAGDLQGAVRIIRRHLGLAG